MSGQTTLKLPGVCWFVTHCTEVWSRQSVASADQEYLSRLSTGRYSQVDVGGQQSESEDIVKKVS